MTILRAVVRGVIVSVIAVVCASGLALAQSSNGVGTPFELAFWQSVSGSDDPAVYEAYLKQYPEGTFSGLAKAKLANLGKINGLAGSQLGSTPTLLLPPGMPLPSTVSPVLPARKEPHPPISLGSSSSSSDVALLAAMAKSQEAGGSTAQVAQAAGFMLPPRPQLSPVPELNLPVSFCSAEDRNAFYDTRYKPIIDKARDNNTASVAHLEKLQQMYDSYQLSRDPSPMNAIAADAKEYQQSVAKPAFDRHGSLVKQFDVMMSTPIVDCSPRNADK